jgi:hypothetical protein
VAGFLTSDQFWACELRTGILFHNTNTMNNLLALALLALLSCAADASRTLQTAEQSGSCGRAGALCGASLSSSCHSSGLGYCQPGLFCGWTFSDTDKKTVCMPVPKDCGQPGQSCCPGNDKTAITDAKATPKPTCGGGSSCFYTPTPDASGWSAPPYASPAGALLGEPVRHCACL